MKFPIRFLFRSGLTALALSCAACSSLPLADSTGHSSSSSTGTAPVVSFANGVVSDVTPHGPGTVFPTIDAAAIDALAYCFLASRQVAAASRAEQGGAIRPVAGGFTYDEPSSSAEAVTGQLRYPLRPGDVAHFQHQPRHGLAGAVRSARVAEREVRRLVDRRDVLNRPVYRLTPERIVHVYAGARFGSQTLARVERGTRRGATALALRAAPQSGTEIVTVEQPWIMPIRTDSPARR